MTDCLPRRNVRVIRVSDTELLRAVEEKLHEDTESCELLGELLSMFAPAKRISGSFSSDEEAGSGQCKICHCTMGMIYESTRQSEGELASFAM